MTHLSRLVLGWVIIQLNSSVVRSCDSVPAKSWHNRQCVCAGTV